MRRALAAEVRKHRPDIVVTGNFRETWGGRNLNQADHIAVGRAVVDAVRDAGNRWVFPEQLVDGTEPWGGVRQVWAFGSPSATHGVDTTDTFDVGVESLKAHSPTSTVSAGRTGTPASSSRGWPVAPGSVSVSRSRRRSRCSPWAGATDAGSRGSRWSTQNSLPSGSASTVNLSAPV